jgi:hypothetical protein
MEYVRKPLLTSSQYITGLQSMQVIWEHLLHIATGLHLMQNISLHYSQARVEEKLKERG